MTRQTLESEIKWDENGIGRIAIYMPLFDKKLEFEFFLKEEEEPATLSDKMIDTVTDVISLAPESLEVIKALLWEECHFSFTLVDFGCTPTAGETEIEAHFRHFGLENPEDAFTRCGIKCVQISQECDRLASRYAEIKVETVTDNLISILVKNGRIIDFDDDGTYIADFETDERHGHHSRQKMLGE